MNQLWKVSYTYEIPADCPHFQMTKEYFIVAVDREEAFTKTDDLFSYCSFNCDLLIQNQVQKKAVIYQRKILPPKLSGSDADDYSLEATLLNSGFLSFIPVKKEAPGGTFKSQGS